MRYTVSRLVDLGVGGSALIFSLGIVQLFRHAPYWPNSEPPSILSLSLYVALTFGIGACVGLFIGLILAGAFRLAHRSGRKPFQIGFFVGLDLVAVVWLWLVPPLA